MTLIDLLLLLLIAGICGSVGQSLAGFSKVGCLGSIALGFIGAALGVWIAQALNLPEVFNLQFGEVNFPIIWSIAGSALFVGVLGAISGRRKRW